LFLKRDVFHESPVDLHYTDRARKSLYIYSSLAEINTEMSENTKPDGISNRASAVETTRMNTDFYGEVRVEQL